MSSVEQNLERLEKEGYVVLDRVLDEAQLSELRAALQPFERDRPMGRNAFEGERTQRVYSLAGKGEAFLRLAEHPAVVEILDRTLLPNWLLSTCQSIRLHPGESAQAWHTDDGFYMIPRPRTKLALSAIWAIDAFTEDNGATTVLPQSHLWKNEHPDDYEARATPVLMPAGSVVLFDGALWHRGGANRSNGPRLAISPQYCQPWLRPQESQLLIVPPERAAACSPRARAMLGYSIHPPFIGQVEGMNPIRLVDPTYHTNNRAEPSLEAKLADKFLKRPVS